MALEGAAHINDLVSANPTAADPKSQGDDHLRMIKLCLQNDFPGLAGRSWRTQSKGATYAALATDNMTYLKFTGAGPWSLTFPAALGNGWMCVVENASSANLTLDPNAAETINGAATLVLLPGYCAFVFNTAIGAAEFSAVIMRKDGSEAPGAVIVGNTALTSASSNKLRIVNASAVVTLPALSTMSYGDTIRLKSTTLGDVTIVGAGGDPMDGTGVVRLPAFEYIEFMASTIAGWIISVMPSSYVGEIRAIGTATLPQGWIASDGSLPLRATYAGLFAAIGTIYGVGDGATTFELPALAGASPMGDGAGTVFIEFGNADINVGTDIVTVAGNVHEFYTGMQGIFTRVSGATDPTTSPAGNLDTGDTVFLIVVTPTSFQFATTLANAQNGVNMNITVAGAGTFRFTHTRTAKVQGRKGGENAHAMTLTELLLHSHVGNVLTGAGAFTFAGGANGVVAGGSTGGNNAMNVQDPYTVVKYMIKL